MAKPRFRKPDARPNALKQSALEKLLAQLSIPDKPAYFVVGCQVNQAEVIVRLALPIDEDDSWEALAYTRRDQAAACFPQYSQICLYRRLPNGRLWDVSNV